MFHTRTSPFFLISIFTVLGMCCVALARKNQVGDAVADAGYFEFVSLAHKADSEHSIPVANANGKTWYRAEEAGADLSYFEHGLRRLQFLEPQPLTLFCEQFNGFPP